MHAITVSTARQEFTQMLDAVQIHLNVAEFQHFSDKVGCKAQTAGMTQDILDGILNRED